MSERDYVVVLRDVSKAYLSSKRREPVVALNGLSLRIERGTLTAIRGASGSGKSTLLNLIGGLDSPDAGVVAVDGQDLSGLKEKELVEFRGHKVGFVFQTFDLLPNLNARENVEFAISLQNVSAHESKEKALELLDRVGLSHRSENRPSQLSGGEQQRVGIARALANEPPLILADEPTGNLDLKSRNEVVRLLVHLAKDQGTTVMIVTHDVNVSDQCDVVNTIEYGRIGKTYVPDPRIRRSFMEGESEQV